jgi:hypothetical protein
MSNTTQIKNWTSEANIIIFYINIFNIYIKYFTENITFAAVPFLWNF